jgi:pimeloyl-ACP methyl ester carboxylesterase
VPTYIVLGECSIIHRSGEVAARVEPINPCIRTEIVPGTTHALSLEKPELITARILDLAQANRADTPE